MPYALKFYMTHANDFSTKVGVKELLQHGDPRLRPLPPITNWSDLVINMCPEMVLNLSINESSRFGVCLVQYQLEILVKELKGHQNSSTS